MALPGGQPDAAGSDSADNRSTSENRGGRPLGGEEALAAAGRSAEVIQLVRTLKDLLLTRFGPVAPLTEFCRVLQKEKGEELSPKYLSNQLGPRPRNGPSWRIASAIAVLCSSEHRPDVLVHVASLWTAANKRRPPGYDGTLIWARDEDRPSVLVLEEAMSPPTRYEVADATPAGEPHRNGRLPRALSIGEQLQLSGVDVAAAANQFAEIWRADKGGARNTFTQLLTRRPGVALSLVGSLLSHHPKIAVLLLREMSEHEPEAAVEIVEMLRARRPDESAELVAATAWHDRARSVELLHRLGGRYDVWASDDTVWIGRLLSDDVHTAADVFVQMASSDPATATRIIVGLLHGDAEGFANLVDTVGSLHHAVLVDLWAGVGSLDKSSVRHPLATALASLYWNDPNRYRDAWLELVRSRYRSRREEAALLLAGLVADDADVASRIVLAWYDIDLQGAAEAVTSVVRVDRTLGAELVARFLVLAPGPSGGLWTRAAQMMRVARSLVADIVHRVFWRDAAAGVKALEHLFDADRPWLVELVVGMPPEWRAEVLAELARSSTPHVRAVNLAVEERLAVLRNNANG